MKYQIFPEMHFLHCKYDHDYRNREFQTIISSKLKVASLSVSDMMMHDVFG